MYLAPGHSQVSDAHCLYNTCVSQDQPGSLRPAPGIEICQLDVRHSDVFSTKADEIRTPVIA